MNITNMNSIWNQYDKHYYVKRTEPNEESTLAVQHLIKGQIYLFQFFETIPYDFDHIDWSIDPFMNKTWVLYFHSLRMVSYLLNEYELTQNELYLLHCMKWIKSWAEANPSKQESKSSQAWRDHSAANRILTFLYFWDYYRNSKVFDQEFATFFIDLLEKHGDFIAKDENYAFHHNHGIMESRALIELSLLFPQFEQSRSWKEISLNRLKDHLINDITDSGVHKEHSPVYHKLVYGFLKSIDDFMTYYNQPTSIFTEVLKKMETYLNLIVKPNTLLPPVGDSIGNEHWLPTQDVTKKVYLDAGVAVYKTMDSYLAFFAGFHSKTHKHADDCSFILSLKNTDYFIDSGLYGYTEQDPYRQYIRSVFAHNALSVDKQTYPIKPYQIQKSGIDTFNLMDDKMSIQGHHDLYTGVHIKRSLDYDPGKGILLIDELQSDSLHHYTQIFNIGKDVTVTIQENQVILHSKVDNTWIKITPLSPIQKIEQYHGNMAPLMGWQSVQMYTVEPITTLLFHQIGQTITFRTLIEFNDEKIAL